MDQVLEEKLPEFKNHQRVLILFENDEFRVVILEYQNIDEPDLYLEYKDAEDEWDSQVPMGINPASAREIGTALIKWADRQV